MYIALVNLYVFLSQIIEEYTLPCTRSGSKTKLGLTNFSVNFQYVLLDDFLENLNYVWHKPNCYMIQTISSSWYFG